MSSSYIEAVDSQALRFPDRDAFRNSRGEHITYAELKRKSDALACWIAAHADIPAQAPLVVYGHKSPYMLVCFLACVKSGHAYVPVDVLYPHDRVASIIDQLGDTAIFDTVGKIPELFTEGVGRPCFDAHTIAAATETEPTADLPEPVGKLDGYYVLFTSGSTGTPKGVKVLTECIDNFSAWLLSGDFAVDGHRIWFNRAPFSFDLSVSDIAGALAHGDTMFALEAEDEASLALTFQALAQSDITEWVSTPSFLEQCLADEAFGPALLPHLKRMLFVGEVLRPEAVRLAQERFPGLRIFNGYGPTESTDFVSLCEITPAMLEQDRSLPIGRTMPGTKLLVLDPDTLEPVPDGEHGELFIVGNTVAGGYWGRPDLTEAAFHSCPAAYIGPGQRSYRTGDEIARDPDGLYYYHGRYDLQIKLHGFRIELGDIEASLCALPEVDRACVLPAWREGAISHLVAFVVPAEADGPRGFALTKQLKHAVRDTIPPYMVPRTFKYLDSLPLNANGKADRKALAAMIAG